MHKQKETPGRVVLRDAQNPILFGLKRMVASHPLYAAFIDRWRLVPNSSSIPTMGVGIARDLYIELHFNPDFIISITPDELVSVLLHEVHHVLFGHLLMKAEDYPDDNALVIAQEVTVNEFISGPLPGGPITLEMFPDLPAHETTQQRYDRLATQFLDDDAAPIDSHELWGTSTSANITPSTLQKVIIADLNDALQALPADIRAHALAQLCDALPNQGFMAGRAAFEIMSGRKATTNWKAVLRRFVWSLAQSTPSLHRPSRRFPELVGIIAGRVRSPKRPKLMVVLDTSGSMIVPAILETIAAEVHSLHSLADFQIVECDMEVQREYSYAGSIKEIVGGGGTSFVEPLRAEFLSKRRIDGVLYFTDGEGDAPESAPRVPVLWCLLGESRKPSSWGKAVTISMER